MAFPRSLVENLPIEILQAIMASLDEAASLPSVILSCSTLYHAFQAAKSVIIQSILASEIGPDTLPEAVANLQTRPREQQLQSSLDINPVLQNFLKRAQPAVVPSLSHAVLLSQFHFYVRHFTSHYISTTLDEVPACFSMNNRLPVTQTEISRIQRAFYRFEVFCNISARSPKWPTLYDQPNRRFLDMFSPWENAQLACLNDYLYRVVSPVFNEFVEHDILWGQCEVPNMDDPTSPHFQHILSRGLCGLYSIATAQSYDDRIKSLYTTYPQHNASFLHRILQAPTFQTEMDLTDLLLQDMTLEQQFEFIHPPFFDEEDTGPIHAWHKAHATDLPFAWIYSSSPQAPLHRQWGYVMWDLKRIDEWILAHRFNHFDREEQIEKRRLEFEARRRVRASWPRRADIHLAGGRGWWSAEDESKVVWSGESSPWDDVEKRASCSYCIGKVRCAPHRMVLKIPGGEGDGENITLLGKLPERRKR